ncbi:MAG TPA: SGNH/GDSL hydrolase family protein [Aeromicrobium sp.]|nr:SGNH/GDSL hydrolase family protein [Aeromicrobium sp.]
MPRPVRTTAKAAAGTAAVGFGTYGLLIGEALLARKRIGTTTDRPPSGNGIYGDDHPGEPIRCLLLGDSTMVGYGMPIADDTPSSQIGLGLSHILDAPIDIRNEAAVGALSRDLNAQIDNAMDHRPQLAMILVGANDITHQVPAKKAARQLAAAVARLRGMGAEVVVGSVPDFGTVKPLPMPLRTVCRYWSRHLARRQTVASVTAGARVVSMADLLEPLFLLKGDALFGEDRFHPSADGYARMSGFLIAAGVAQWRARDVLASLELDTEERMTLDDAAEWASEHGGTQVAPAAGGRRWANVLRRRR